MLYHLIDKIIADRFVDDARATWDG